MRQDQTRTKEFWRSPERYRLAYVLDIVPAVAPYGLARGIAFHTTLDLHAKGHASEEIKAVLCGTKPDGTGRTLKLTPNAIMNGWEMARAYIEQAAPYELVASEAEFDVPIEGSPHSMVGRLDQIVIDSRGHKWLLEFKTANTRTRYEQKVTDWMSDYQADFEILGARSLGHADVKGVKVQYVVESAPPNVWPEIHVTRTEAQLQRTKLLVHQTCETIEMFKATFGKEMPWPHLGQWPCIGECEKCDYSHICRKEGPMVPEELQGFMRREEHLEILR